MADEPVNLAGAYNGLAFGPGTPYRVNRLQGLYDLDGVQTNDLPRSAGGGFFAGNDRPGGRTIILGLALMGGTPAGLQALRAALAAATDPQDKELPLQLMGNTVYVMARPRQRTIPIDAEYQEKNGIATIQFFCSTRTIHQGAPPP